jgi:hypothetical protein
MAAGHLRLNAQKLEAALKVIVEQHHIEGANFNQLQ